MIILSPYSASVRQDVRTYKNWPDKNWDFLVQLIKRGFPDLKIIQVGVKGEREIQGVDVMIPNMPFEAMTRLITDCDFFISVDNFFPHFANLYDKYGIVLFGPSNPKHFGYENNRNLFKSKKKFRQYQFFNWHDCMDCHTKNFVGVDEVYKEVKKLLL